MSSEVKFDVEILEYPKLKNPTLICGLPGSGFVGKLAVDYLIEKLHAKKFADIFSSSFPPQVIVQSNGTLDLIKNSLYYVDTESKDLILMTGDAQPVSAPAEYALADEIIGICKKLNVSEIYTLAAYITGKFTQNPKVFGTATILKIIEEFEKFGVTKLKGGNITGMNGVLIGSAKKSEIAGICLLGETSGYVIDAKASRAVLQILLNMVKIQVDMSDLDKKAEDTEKVIRSIESQAVPQHSQNQGMSMPSRDVKNLDYIS